MVWNSLLESYSRINCKLNTWLGGGDVISLKNHLHKYMYILYLRKYRYDITPSPVWHDTQEEPAIILASNGVPEWLYRLDHQRCRPALVTLVLWWIFGRLGVTPWTALTLESQTRKRTMMRMRTLCGYLYEGVCGERQRWRFIKVDVSRAMSVKTCASP